MKRKAADCCCSGLPEMLDMAPEAIVVTDISGQIRALNREAERLFRYSREEMKGQPIDVLVQPRQARPTRRLQHNRPLVHADADSIAHLSLLGKRRDGSEFPLEMSAREWDSEGCACVIEVIHDATEIENQRAELQRRNAELRDENAHLVEQLMHDALTGVLSRSAVVEQLSGEVSRARRYGLPLTLLMVDVDRFKAYNDRFGHPAGDWALRTVASILQEGLRTADYVARFGGEEFLVVLPSTPLHEATPVAERLRLAIADHAWPLRGVTVSIGAASLDLAADDVEALVESADRALYAAKAGGRNRVTTAHEPASDRALGVAV